MKLCFWVLCLVLATWPTAECNTKRFLVNNEVCYGDLGCFNTKSPFWSLQRPLSYLPDTPEKINTRFWLYTKNNGGKLVTTELKHTTAGNVAAFKAGQPTRFIIHGYEDYYTYSRVATIRDALLRKGSMNVVAVDWWGGNSGSYFQAASNAQVVGVELARLITALNQRAGQSLADVHIIGHSLGAHAAGYAGKRVRTVGRITGLDPAEPYFQNTDPIVRLDKTDAAFVDVIHTDGSSIFAFGLGMIQAVGHLDFYPNGGLMQPGCPKDYGNIVGGLMGALSLNFDALEAVIGCSHDRSVHFFVESIEATACNFVAYPCANFNDFQAGNCTTTCSGSSCPIMGYKADQFRGPEGSYFLETKATSPFCK